MLSGAGRYDTCCDASSCIVTAVAGVAVTVQADMDAHWPGAHGSPQPLSDPSHLCGVVGLWLGGVCVARVVMAEASV